MKSYIIPLLASITIGAAALVSELVPSLLISMTLVSVGVAMISTLIQLFLLAEARRQGQLKSTLISTLVMTAITITLIMWLLPRIPVEKPITPPQITPTTFPRA